MLHLELLVLKRDDIEIIFIFLTEPCLILICKNLTLSHLSNNNPMKQYIDFIEKTVRERCPELQELSEWCVVRENNKKFRDAWDREIADRRFTLFRTDTQWWDIHQEQTPIYTFIEAYWADTCIVQIPKNKFHSDDRYQILWHPIHLEHILRTMGGDFGISGDWTTWRNWAWDNWNDSDDCEEPKYNLSLSWKEQEEPVLKFLAETLWFNQ